MADDSQRPQHRAGDSGILRLCWPQRRGALSRWTQTVTLAARMSPTFNGLWAIRRRESTCDGRPGCEDPRGAIAHPHHRKRNPHMRSTTLLASFIKHKSCGSTVGARGAADAGVEGIIPGSMGTLSYHVEGRGNEELSAPAACMGRA